MINPSCAESLLPSVKKLEFNCIVKVILARHKKIAFSLQTSCLGTRVININKHCLLSNIINFLRTRNENVTTRSYFPVSDPLLELVLGDIAVGQPGAELNVTGRCLCFLALHKKISTNNLPSN